MCTLRERVLLPHTVVWWFEWEYLVPSWWNCLHRKAFSVASLEEVCHWGWALRLQSPRCYQLLSLAHALSYHSSTCLSACCCAPGHDQGLWTHKPQIKCISSAVLPWRLSNRKVTETPSTFILSVLKGTFYKNKLTLWLYNREEKTKNKKAS